MNAPTFPLLRLGFRTFFLAAGTWAVFAMLAWAAAWSGRWQFGAVPVMAWHAHEMIYGYALAVVAGFLLTAVPNWTGRPTPRGPGLAALAALWLAARLALASVPDALVVAAVLDLAFDVLLLVAVARPIVAVRQWRQAGILAKLLLLGGGNLSFYLAAGGIWPAGQTLALHGGVFLLVALILTIAGRVMPGFISRGVRTAVTVVEPRGATGLTLVLFLAFFVAELAGADPRLAGLCAAALVLVTTRRLAAWHTRALWREPLLWGLYLAVVAIDAGFLLYALAGWFDVPRSLALHAFAAGGIGLATLAMMARVALGHTGRDIRTPPRALAPALGLLVLAVLARVVLPLAAPMHYAIAIELAQGLWIAAFAIFVFTYAPILWQPRVDGRDG
ncbi:MAG: NnrS family protein [Gammaproteobacteria bacterium]|nr:NnrS family protein [Gammaproteobacteria bacterium]